MSANMMPAIINLQNVWWLSGNDTTWWLTGVLQNKRRLTDRRCDYITLRNYFYVSSCTPQGGIIKNLWMSVV